MFNILKTSSRYLQLGVMTVFLIGLCSTGLAQEKGKGTGSPKGLPEVVDPSKKPKVSDKEKIAKRQKKKWIADFEKYLTGATLEGHFTINGKENGKKNPEKYTIVEAKKGKKGDRWTIKARIQYGKHDVVVPVGVKILWAGKTPVITLERTPIIGMGTFSARVLFNEGMYSGTWKHDDNGGHLFGKVIPAKKEGVKKKVDAAKSKGK